MLQIDSLILITGVLLLLGIASSKFSARLGVPVLVLFLGLGMLAGSEGIGGIEFENYELAHAIGTVALALILFDGGLSTSLAAVRSAWKPSVVLATWGVLVTSVVTGLGAAWILNIPLIEGMLLGSIVGSTDAAAVFAVLRSGGVHLQKRLTSILEIESASNDPMAIFLTIGLIEVVTGQMEFGPELLGLFASQMFFGALVGLAIGFLTVWIVNHINLEVAGMYPVLVCACALFAFGLAALIGGSGFLATYLAGLIIGNSSIVFKRGILGFHDAGAWLGQIAMFVVLGLLIFPHQLIAVTGRGLLVALVLIFVARPVAVLLSVFMFRFNWRELVFLSWVGLKGAVPITLSIFPLLFGVPNAKLIFDVVFFIVVISAAAQGWSLPYLARWLGLEIPAPPQAPVTLELSSLRHIEGDIVDFTITDDSRAAGKLVRELALPEGVVIAIVARDQKLIPPQGSTRIEPGDHVILVMHPERRALVNRVFARKDVTRLDLPEHLEFPLRASTTVGELEEFYGINLNAPSSTTLDQVLRDHLGNDTLSLGACVAFGPIKLSVRTLNPGGVIERVGLEILSNGSASQSA